MVLGDVSRGSLLRVRESPERSPGAAEAPPRTRIPGRPPPAGPAQRLRGVGPLRTVTRPGDRKAAPGRDPGPSRGAAAERGRPSGLQAGAETCGCVRRRSPYALTATTEPQSRPRKRGSTARIRVAECLVGGGWARRPTPSEPWWSRGGRASGHGAERWMQTKAKRRAEGLRVGPHAHPRSSGGQGRVPSQSSPAAPPSPGPPLWGRQDPPALHSGLLPAPVLTRHPEPSQAPSSPAQSVGGKQPAPPPPAVQLPFRRVLVRPQGR